MSEQTSCDVFVIFGITGDLAKVMTFHSLYRLEQRKLLDCPIVGVAVDDWTLDQLVERARTSIVGTGEQLDEAVFDAPREPVLATSRATSPTRRPTSAWPTAIKGARRPVFYLEIPPFLFGTVVKGLSEPASPRTRASWSRSRSGTTSSRPARSPTSCTSTSTSRSSSASTTTSARWGSRRSSISASRTRCSSRSGTGTTSSACRSRWRRTSASRTAVTSTTRSARSATSSSTTSCRWSPPPRWKRRPAAIPRRSRTRRPRCSARSSTADPAHYVRGQYDGYRSIDGVAADSTTETYAALRLDIENWRWSGVPFFIRTGKRLPVTQTEVRLVFKEPPRLGFGLRDASVGTGPAGRQARPLHRHPLRARGPPSGRPRGPSDQLDMEFADEGGEGATPYEVLLHAAMVGQTVRFTRQDTVEEHGASCSRCSTRHHRCTPTRPAPGVPRPRRSWSLVTAAGVTPGSPDDRTLR